MENTKITKEVCDKVNAVLETNEGICDLLSALTKANSRYNEVRFDKVELTEDEVKANVTEATLLAVVDDACDKLNRAVKKCVYETLFEIRKDAMPAILLGEIPQYSHKDMVEKDEDSSVTTHAVTVKPAPISIKNYDAWANREHDCHIVADTSYFEKVDTLAYWMLTGIARQLGVDTLKNYKFVNGFTKDIAASKVCGPKASKTTICAEVQKCLDALLFVPRDDGKNTYKAISKDVTFLQNVVCSAGKDRCTLQAMKAGKFLSKVEDVMFRVITDREYAVSYTVEKPKA